MVELIGNIPLGEESARLRVEDRSLTDTAVGASQEHEGGSYLQHEFAMRIERATTHLDPRP